MRKKIKSQFWSIKYPVCMCSHGFIIFPNMRSNVTFVHLLWHQGSIDDFLLFLFFRFPSLAWSQKCIKHEFKWERSKCNNCQGLILSHFKLGLRHGSILNTTILAYSKTQISEHLNHKVTFIIKYGSIT